MASCFTSGPRQFRRRQEPFCRSAVEPAGVVRRRKSRRCRESPSQARGLAAFLLTVRERIPIMRESLLSRKGSGACASAVGNVNQSVACPAHSPGGTAKTIPSLSARGGGLFLGFEEMRPVIRLSPCRRRPLPAVGRLFRTFAESENSVCPPCHPSSRGSTGEMPLHGVDCHFLRRWRRRLRPPETLRIIELHADEMREFSFSVRSPAARGIACRSWPWTWSKPQETKHAMGCRPWQAIERPTVAGWRRWANGRWAKGRWAKVG